MYIDGTSHVHMCTLYIVYLYYLQVSCSIVAKCVVLVNSSTMIYAYVLLWMDTGYRMPNAACALPGLNSWAMGCTERA